MNRIFLFKLKHGASIAVCMETNLGHNYILVYEVSHEIDFSNFCWKNVLLDTNFFSRYEGSKLFAMSSDVSFGIRSCATRHDRHNESNQIDFFANENCKSNRLVHKVIYRRTTTESLC